MPPALVLAAGLGTRLRPLTFCRAKAAVPVAGIPLIARHTMRLAAQGIEDIVVNLHHRPESIAAALGDGVALGCRVRYSWERVVLGSAGGPRHALPLLGDRFFLINSDTLCDVDLEQLYEAHRARGAKVTLAVTRNPAPERYGGIVTDPNGWVVGFAGAGDRRRPLHFVGIQVAEASVFSPLPDGVPAASIRGLYDSLLSRQQIAAHPVDGRFLDIGTPADYLTATRIMGAAEAHADPSLGLRCFINPSARVTRSVLWDDVTIGSNCRVADCVVTDGVQLPDGVTLKGQAVVRMPQDTRVVEMPGARRLGDLLAVPIEHSLSA